MRRPGIEPESPSWQPGISRIATYLAKRLQVGIPGKFKSVIKLLQEQYESEMQEYQQALDQYRQDMRDIYLLYSVALNPLGFARPYLNDDKMPELPQKPQNPSIYLRRNKKYVAYNNYLKSKIINEECIENLKSQQELAVDFNVSWENIRRWTQEYLEMKFGAEFGVYLYRKYNKMHSSSKPEVREEFINYLEGQIIEFYPNFPYYIDSLNKLARDFSITRITATAWVKAFLANNYGLEYAKQMYHEIWSIRRFTLDTSKVIEYIAIQKYIENRGGKLITTEEEFQKMTEIPSRRMVKVECEHKHTFIIQTGSMLYRNRWCPQCQDYKTEHIMRLFMERIFGAKFPETSLYRAFNIRAILGGRLRLDGYCSYVIVNAKVYKIAFEYDGAQHDIYPNAYHNSKKEFLVQKARDLIKRKILLEKGVVLINLKKVDGYDIDTIRLFQSEIIRQFEEITNEKLSPHPKYIYDPLNKVLKMQG